MMIKDCPVGSVVRLVSLRGNPHPEERHNSWVGEYTVMVANHRKYVIDGNGNVRDSLSYDPDYQFEIVHPAPEPRITFTVGGQEFYVGQRVWNLEDGGILKSGEEIEILGVMSYSNYYVTVRKIGTHQVCQGEVELLSTTPPDPHKWKRGDWARHEAIGVVFITGQKSYNDCAIFVTDDKGVGHHISSSELTFISHSEPPK